MGYYLDAPDVATNTYRICEGDHPPPGYHDDDIFHYDVKRDVCISLIGKTYDFGSEFKINTVNEYEDGQMRTQLFYIKDIITDKIVNAFPWTETVQDDAEEISEQVMEMLIEGCLLNPQYVDLSDE